MQSSSKCHGGTFYSNYRPRTENISLIAIWKPRKSRKETSIRAATAVLCSGAFRRLPNVGSISEAGTPSSTPLVLSVNEADIESCKKSHHLVARYNLKADQHNGTQSERVVPSGGFFASISCTSQRLLGCLAQLLSSAAKLSFQRPLKCFPDPTSLISAISSSLSEIFCANR